VGAKKEKMNEPSPLVPQGSFEAQARRKSHVRIAVFGILAVHVVVLGGLLILGCKREDKPTTELTETPPPMTNDLTPPPFGSDVVTTSAPPVAPTNVIGGLPPVQPPVVPRIMPPPEAGAVADHKIAKGESFSTLALKYGVSLKAIVDANPNLTPTKLQIGDVVKIPAKTPAPDGAGTTPVADAADTYTVKSGDVLGSIATKHGTTVKEIQRLNNLATTQIKVGQKLKLPPKAAPPAGAVPPAQ
jgi:LysM repeat protein